MTDRKVTQKVVCYVVRGDELLVFQHLDEPWDESGLQAPAGSIEPGETPEDAALREAREETGLHSWGSCASSARRTTTCRRTATRCSTGTSSG